MLSSNLQAAVVYNLIDHSTAEYLVKKGYTHTVVVCDREDYSANGVHAEVIDLVDFKNEFAARTYADSINLQNGEDNA